MSGASVKRRWVLYVSGFDPAGPAKYHQLYKEQSALAASLLQAQIEVGERSNRAADKLAQWPVRHVPVNSQAAAVETDFVFARWDDLVRQNWLPLRNVQQVWAFLQAFFATHWLYWRSGAMLRMLRLARPPALALILPLLITLGGLLLMLSTISLGVWSGISSLYLDQKVAFAGIGTARSAIIFIVISIIWFIAAWQFEKRWHSLWLLRSFIFTRLQALGQTPDLEARLDLHAQHIRKAAASGLYDEILVIGHSSGCIMASLTLARALPLSAPSSSQISLLTLGHWWPLLTCLPQAKAQHLELAHLSQHEHITWVDASAAADGCCFAFKDPLLALPQSIQRAHIAKIRPKLVSTRWHTLFTAAQYLALKRDRFRFHFQYLYATPKLGDCDFYAITSSSQSLAERFASIPSVKA
ncbi:hypothetical protein [Variovorax sp. PCZ-1]|uniref:hypothetical protein n=1 Tax=Variovorax sp. PCZ-1 TaxID=2835533 RepID=UPI001BCBEBE9|nr:hypothetical protein [Variovorax sp. PCZ-1]MBS7807663.1 hypothetical protein [Variovorax sp. PCZ-1]